MENKKNIFSRDTLEHPPFGIDSIRISNVGAIDDLAITFDSSALLSIYAGNGVGKTTVLECMSLIGHLPCFPTFCVDGQIEESLLTQKIGRLGETHVEKFALKIELATLPGLGLRTWLDNMRPGKNAEWSLIEFEIFDKVDEHLYANHRFCVFLDLATSERKSGDMKITSILSRGDFDSVGGSQLEFADDRTIGQCGLIVYDKQEQTGQEFLTLVHKIAKGRTFCFLREEDGVPRLVQDALAIETEIEPRSVSYINTDLNDFGRGNDLRESPKDLTRSFGSEMYSRLGIELNKAGAFSHMRALSNICEKILETPVYHYSDRRAITPSFRLAALVKRDNKFTVSVDRRDGEAPIPISFLSAGENEVFFVILMLLNFTRNSSKGHSIILLDEPDLHIANIARREFFEAIIDLVRGKSQLVTSTHSSALYDHLRGSFRSYKRHIQVLMRVVIDDHSLRTILTAKYDGLFLGKVRRLGHESNILKRVRAAIVSFMSYHSARISSVVDLNSYALWAAIAVWVLSLGIFGVLLAGAGLNDALNTDETERWIRVILFANNDPTQYHTATRNALMASFVSTIAPVIAIASLRFRARRKQTRLQEKVRLKYSRED